MIISKIKDSKKNLCNFCFFEQPTCKKADYLKFGDEKGNDNITECSEFVTDDQKYLLEEDISINGIWFNVNGEAFDN